MTGSSRQRIALETLAIFAFALAVRASQIGQEASGDELFHVLAARQYGVDGTLTIHGGEPYDRVRSFTLVVAWLFQLFGESLVVARLPAVLAGSALAAVAYAWLASRGERVAGGIAGVLVALDPELVRLSQMCRFYAPQHLLFFLGTIAAFAACDGARALGRRALAAAFALLCLWAAQKVQIVSRIGIGGIGLYVALVSAEPAWRALRAHRVARVGAALAAAAAAGLAVLVVQQGWHENTLELSRRVDLWAAGDAGNWRYYHHVLLDTWPSLWTLFPAAVLVALVAAPRVALLCACVFGTAVVVHSFMAFKTPRFVSYALPFFLVTWALALSRLVPALARAVEGAASHLPAPRALALAATAAAVLFAVATNNAFVRTARLATADPTFRDSISFVGAPPLSWGRASRELAPLVAAADAVVVTEDVKALYYLGRADFVINHDHLLEDLPLDGPPREQFAVDPKIDVPVVSQPAALDRIARCHRNGLLVMQTGYLNADWVVPRETRAHLLARFERVPLPAEWGVTALRWTTPEPAPADACALRATWRDAFAD